MPVETTQLWERLTSVLGTEDVAKIQDTLKEAVTSVQAVYKWRDGKGIPSLQAFILISDSTGSSLHWLITGKGSPFIENEESLPLSSEERHAIVQMAASTERTFSEMVAQLAREHLMELRAIPDNRMRTLPEEFTELPDEQVGRVVKQMFQAIASQAKAGE
jgi:ATP-dependent protease HslVU (ClpYQ) peptidase subunit